MRTSYLVPAALCFQSFFSDATAALTFVPMSESELVAASDVIVVGVVADIVPNLPATSGGVPLLETVVTLRVGQSLKAFAPQHLNVGIPGGEYGNVRRTVFGAPNFFLGERVLLFLRHRPDGSLAPVGLSLGKYTVFQRGGVDVVRPQVATSAEVQSLRLDAESPAAFSASLQDETLEAVMRRLMVHAKQSSPYLPIVTPTRPRQNSRFFTFVGPPYARWFEPSFGLPVVFSLVPNGDASLSPEQATRAVELAAAAWSSAGTPLSVAISVAGEPAPFRGCDGQSTIQFGDPYDEIGPPVGCKGVLAVGGFCSTVTNAATTSMGETVYRITEGDVTVNDGFSGCRYWTVQNIAEVVTHELGHAIGLGHSSELFPEPNTVLATATMYYLAHFDGRGAALREDDVAGARALYGTRARNIPTRPALRRPRPLPKRRIIRNR